MWKKFTESARRLIVTAQQIGWQAAEDEVEPVHLLAALLQLEDTYAMRAFAALEVDLEALREALPAPTSSAVRPDQPPADMEFSDIAKRVLTQAYNEARLRGHGFIGTPHLLLAMLMTDPEVTGRCLSELGADDQALRKWLDSLPELSAGPLIEPGAAGPTRPPAGEDGLWMTMTAAIAVARAYGARQVEEYHLLLASAAQPACAELMLAFDATPLNLYAAVLAEHPPPPPGHRRARIDGLPSMVEVEPLRAAAGRAARSRRQPADAAHLLLALAEAGGEAAQVLAQLGMNWPAIGEWLDGRGPKP